VTQWSENAMETGYPNPRIPECEVDSMFTDRWSPRAFVEDPLPAHQIKALFEAARWAPSCYNEQPWFFIYATAAEDRRVFASLLMEKNQKWAAGAPLLIFVLARKHFARNNKDNRHARFDAGAAWMSLALQARRLGLYAHAMAGFHLEKAHRVLGVPPEAYDIMAAVAVGRKGDPAQLPEDFRSVEGPSRRKPLKEIATDSYPLAIQR
jgi:nitroreductase